LDPLSTIDTHIPTPTSDSNTKLTREAATEIFKTVGAFAKKRIWERQFKSIGKDVEVCLDEIEKFFEEPEWKNVKVTLNREIITHFLRGEIDLESVSPRVASRLGGVLEFGDGERERVNGVYFDLYFIQGSIAWNQSKLKTDPTRNVRKNLGNVEYAAEKFSYHLYLNPKSFEAWIGLGCSYAHLASYLMVFSAEEVVGQRRLVGDFQKKAFNAFVQATKLIPTTKAEKQTFIECFGGRKFLASELWGEFGYLLLSILNSPMGGSALEGYLGKAQREWAERFRKVLGNEVGGEGDGGGVEGKRKYGFEIGAYCFKQALALDKGEWQWSLGAGRCYEKLGREWKAVIPLYQRAIELVPEDSGIKENEKIMIPALKLLSFLRKGLWRGEIEPLEVITILNDSFPRFAPPTAPASGANSPPASPTRIEENAILNDPPVNLTNGSSIPNATNDRIRAFDRILEELKRNKAVNKWYHKPSYQIAWIRYHIYNDAKGALEEILTKFSKQNFVHFWTHAFQRPGKHFVYIHKYTVFMIELAKAAKDVETLRYLCNRLKKADVAQVLFECREVWRMAFDALYDVVQTTSSGSCTRLSGTMTKTTFEKRAAELDMRIQQDRDVSEKLGAVIDLKKLRE
ncbi:Histone transcription regulator 3, partial [Rhizophlyctis rosea]